MTTENSDLTSGQTILVICVIIGYFSLVFCAWVRAHVSCRIFANLTVPASSSPLDPCRGHSCHWLVAADASLFLVAVLSRWFSRTVTVKHCYFFRLWLPLIKLCVRLLACASVLFVRLCASFAQALSLLYFLHFVNTHSTQSRWSSRGELPFILITLFSCFCLVGR